jgi:hypothetical protein
MPNDEYVGQTVVITSGTGHGQERSIQSHTSTVLTVSPSWTVVPDASSIFAIADHNWQFAAHAKEATAEFTVPNREGTTIHISVRSANARNEECAYSLSPLTRWYLTGDPGAAVDSGAPPTPIFGLELGEQGTFDLVSVSFADLSNTRSINSGTLSVHYWNELNGPTPFQVVAAVPADGGLIEISPAGSAQAGDILQINGELLEVTSVATSGGSYGIIRGVLGSVAAPINAADRCYHLSKKTFVVPFQRDFFGSPASGSYSHSIFQPDVRIAAAELFVTNSRGNSAVRQQAYTGFTDYGLRTLSGGQYSIQVAGYLAVQSPAAPPLVIESSHSVRDVFATVIEAPEGGDIELTVRVDGSPFCILTIAAGTTSSISVNGFELPPLHTKSVLTVDISAVPAGSDALPGKDLTVTIRL